MNFFSRISRIFFALPKANEVDALARKLAAEWNGNHTIMQRIAAGERYDAALEELCDFCESDPAVKAVMISEFNNLSREDLKTLYADLKCGGLGKYAVATVTYAYPLQYIPRARKRGDDWGKIVFTLRNYWESGGTLP